MSLFLLVRYFGLDRQAQSGEEVTIAPESETFPAEMGGATEIEAVLP